MSDINIGALSEALNDKADRDMKNTAKPARAIVETYSDADGNWYEVYSDGWLRQGGVLITTTLMEVQTITFLKAFANTNYTFTNNVLYAGTFDTAYTVEYTTNQQIPDKRTVTGVQIRYTISRSWTAEGQGAIN